MKEADFISFDLELTGLGRSLGERNNELDTPAQRYLFNSEICILYLSI